MRRFLLIALLGIAVTPLACGRLGRDARTRGGAGAGANAGGEVDAEGEPTEGSPLPADKLDVCSQLTREEVEAALGRPVKEPMRGTELSSRRTGTLTSSCMFGGEEGFVSLGVKRQSPNATTAWYAAKAFEELKDRIVEANSGESLVKVAEVSGIGAGAFAETKEETVNFQTTELRVLSRRSILTVRVVGLLEATSSFDAARTLAEKALPRLEEYERAGIIRGPESAATANRPEADPDDDKSQETRDRARAERKDAKEAERSAARDDKKAAASKAGKDGSRRADDRADSKQGKKSARESAKKSPEKPKKESPKTAKANAGRKKRT
jgi:hypothetical protein